MRKHLDIVTIWGSKINIRFDQCVGRDVDVIENDGAVEFGGGADGDVVADDSKIADADGGVDEAVITDE